MGLWISNVDGMLIHGASNHRVENQVKTRSLRPAADCSHAETSCVRQESGSDSVEGALGCVVGG